MNNKISYNTDNQYLSKFKNFESKHLLNFFILSQV
ncbi:hypothetical protein BA6E_125131 [Bacteroidales bacterium 6E]|nr:hypothetical protein BA6E_125131 [Bacteroidales bacterium 6E]